MLDSQDHSDDYAARVAAEVSARYGLTVQPDVVRKVEAGASGLPQVIWDGKQLVFAEFQGKSIGAIWRHQNRQRNRPTDERRRGLVDPEGHARRLRVEELHAGGATDTDMSEALAVPIKVIRKDRMALKLRANLSPRRQPSTVTQIRMARLRHLVSIGATRKEMVADMGINADILRDLAQKANVTLPARIYTSAPKPVRKPAPKGDVVPKVVRPKATPAPRKPSPAELRAKRHAALLALPVSDLTVADLCARLGVKPETMREDLRLLKLTAAKAPARADEMVRARRLAELRQMDLSGLTVRQLMQQFGCSAPVMRRDLAEIGVKPAAEAKSGLSAAQEAAIAARRARIAALVAKGATRAGIMAAEQISRLTMVEDLKALGLTLPRAAESRPRAIGEQSQQALDALRAQIRQMRSEGMTIKQIARAVGRANGTVSHHLTVMGLSGSHGAGREA